MNTNPVVIGVVDKQPTALQFAAAAALARTVDLHVIHAVEPLISGDIVVSADERAQASGQAVLDEAKVVLDTLDARPQTMYELNFGSPTSILCEAAEKASMVVVGTDEAKWIDRLGTDRVTERLAKHADVPVAIVPERSRTHHTGTGVYVALDGKSPAAGPLRFAFAEADRQRRKKLHVIHALAPGTSVDEMNAIRADVSEALAGWSELYPDVQVTRRLVFDETDDGCVDATREASLFVLGRVSHPGFSGIFGHPVITQIARRTHCPSVVVPNDWKDG